MDDKKHIKLLEEFDDSMEYERKENIEMRMAINNSVIGALRKYKNKLSVTMMRDILNNIGADLVEKGFV